MMNSLFVSTGQRVETFTYCDGDGPPVVMLHGMLSTSDCWTYNYDHFIRYHRVIAPDLPGHGRSARGARPYSLTYYSHWLSDFLDQLSLHAVTLVGHSMGGAISLAYAMVHPERLKRLILVNPLGLSGKLPWGSLKYIITGLPDYVMAGLSQRADPYLLRFFQPWVMLNPWGSARPVVEYIASLNQPHRMAVFWSGMRLLLTDFLLERSRSRFLAQLRQIAIPTLIVWGRHDGLLPLEQAYPGIQSIPGARLEILENSAHGPMLEEPDRFNTIMQEFMARTA